MNDTEVINKLKLIQSEFEDSAFDSDKYEAIDRAIYYIEKYGVK